MRMMRLAAVFGCAAIVLMACSSVERNTKDISGMMPDLQFSLTSENDKAVTASDYRGKINIVFFGYTFCPDVCPTTLARLSRILGELDASARADVQVLFVSVDPERDTLERLRSYTNAFGEDFIGLTGTQKQLRALTKRYRVTYGYGEADEDGNYTVSHSGAIFVFDRSGAAQLLLRQSDSVEHVVADLRALVAQ